MCSAKLMSVSLCRHVLLSSAHGSKVVRTSSVVNGLA